MLSAVVLLLISCSALFASPGKEDKLVPPVIGVGPGILFYKGDISSNGLSESILSQAGLQFDLQVITKTRISVSAFLMAGKASANSYDYTKPLNFESTVISTGLQARYDFLFKKKPNAIVIPFIAAGVEHIYFKSNTDLLDAQGRAYNYWSDGTIRSEAEGSLNAPNAVLLYRDFVYETNVRDADLNGLGDYRENGLAFPFSAGVRMQLSERSSIHFTGTYHLLQTDLIDGVTKQGTRERQGDGKNDRLIFTCVQFRYDLAQNRRKKDDASAVDFKVLEKEDADKDGVPDVKDAITETGAKNVDEQGRPIDSDGDDIPDFRDKEPRTKSGAIVNEDGMEITPKMIEEQLKRDSVAALPAVVEYVKNYDRLNTTGTKNAQGKSTPKVIPMRYRFVDTNKDGFISPPEIGKATEDFMAGKSPLESKDFYKMIDYYFKQYQ